MAKKKEEKEEKVEIKKETPQEEKPIVKKDSSKVPIIQLVMESKEDNAIIIGALNKKGLYLDFIDDLENNNQKSKLSKEEFDKIIKEYKYGEL